MPTVEPLCWKMSYGVQVAMSVAADGDPRQLATRLAWSRRHAIPPPLVLRQVHGSKILSASSIADLAEAEGDALVSEGPAIAVYGADCPSLVLAAPDVLAVAHCGWRGCAAGLVGAVISAVRGRSQHPPASWAALVGPGAHPDDYEVDAPVLGARAWPPGTLRSGRPGHGWLDLPGAIAADCTAAGLGLVARCPLATSRDRRLHSHRRDGAGAPQILVAWRPSTCVG